MKTCHPNASHFCAWVGTVEEWTETYERYVEGTPQTSDTAMQKEHQQSSKLCSGASWCGEEHMG